MAKRKQNELSAGELAARLRERYAPPAYAFFSGVCNATGGFQSRTADGMALSLWPSRGLELHGFEIKSSRPDWLRELKNPAKADDLFGYCQRWWVVVADKDIVAAGELPPTWGLIAAHGKWLRVVVDAPLLAGAELDLSFVAALVRRVHEQHTDEARLKERLEAERAQAYKTYHQRHDTTCRAKADLERVEKALADFEKASGVRIATWGGGDVGKALSLVQRGEAAKELRRLEGVRTQLESSLSAVTEALSKGKPSSKVERITESLLGVRDACESARGPLRRPAV